MGQLFQPGGAGYFVPTVHSLPPAAGGYYGPPQQMRASSRWSQQMPRPPMMPGSGSGTSQLNTGRDFYLSSSLYPITVIYFQTK